MQQRRDAKRRTARAVAAYGTSITDIYGVGPIVAGTVLGYVRDIRRFPTRDRFAAYNGTAPIEVSSGDRVIYRLSRRGNRQLNHAIHMAAVTQIRHHDTEGRAYYEPQDRRRDGRQGGTACAETQDQRRDLRAHDRRRAPHAQAARTREGNRGTTTVSSVAGSHPETTGSSDKPLPGRRQP